MKISAFKYLQNRNFGYAARMNSTTGATFSGIRVPKPPGTSKTSMSSKPSAKVRVGTIDWLVVWPVMGVPVGTGSSVAASTCNDSGVLLDSRFRMSRGPKTSKAWNPGNNATAKRVGGLPPFEEGWVDIVVCLVIDMVIVRSAG